MKYQGSGMHRISLWNIAECRSPWTLECTMAKREKITLGVDLTPSHRLEIEVQSARLVASEELSGSPRLQQLLTYLVKETLDGRSDRIKGVTIVQDVFGQSDPEIAQASTVVSVEARRLRRKLTDYYLTAGVNDPVVITIPKGTFVPVFQDVSSQTNTQSASGPEENSPKRRVSGGRLIFFLALAASMLVGSIWLWNTGATMSEPAGYHFEQPAIAVMPFRNSTGSPVNDGLAAGLTEDLTTDLARLREIDVISYSSVSRLAGQDISPAEIGKALKVSHILQGSIRGTAPNVRITAELMNAVSGKLIWADRLDRDFDDPLAFQNEIASRVVEGMSVGIAAWKDQGRKAAPSADPEAAALFEQAIGLANPPADAARLKIAQLAFRAVIEADPSYAGGYAGVAYIGAFKALWGHVPNPEAEATASAALAQQALIIDPKSSLALDALALSKLVLRNFDAAVRMSERAIEVAPNDPYAHSYHAFILTANGQADAAIPFAERAVRLDPLEPRTPYLNILSFVQIHSGNYVGALRSLLESERKGGPHAAGHVARKAAAYVGLGEPEKAAVLMASLPPGFVEGPWLDWQLRSFRFAEDALLLQELLKQAN
jgi:TolB-like protein